VRDLRRMVVYVYSETHQSMTWSGSVRIETFGRLRIEIPLGHPRPAAVLVALSVYNLCGELQLRNEDLRVPGTVRAAALAFGFYRISWADQPPPLT
jgi:hypothetical protein